MVSELGSMLESRLNLWKLQGNHAAFPENLLVYRDGVSQKQYVTVLEAELPLLRNAYKNLYPQLDRKKGLPQITIIIVVSAITPVFILRMFPKPTTTTAIPNVAP